MDFFKTICVFLSVLGTVRMELLARDVLVFYFSWCGFPEICRRSEAHLYYLFIPVVCIGLLKCWKKKRTLDSVVRITVLCFLGAVLIYWFFEDCFDYRWLTW